ncbi:MAG: translation initiation factor IF-3, partial [Acetobacteraceae bacterium]|nr:translation initiation factor IF-3 [Acetobacteraceae bacterium]
MPAPPTRDGPRVNEEIRAPQVRLIDQNGEMQGVMTARDALQRAYTTGLDLLEISPNADPPVVKILDFGKFKYEQQKKKNEARKKQKVIEIKEIKV